MSQALRAARGIAPPGLLSRVPLPTDLVDAIAEVLEREANEPDLAARTELLSCARRTLQGWLSGTLTTEQAIEALALAIDPKSGIVLRPLRGRSPTA